MVMINLKKPRCVKKHLSQVQYIVCGFTLMILTGTFLLMLPISSNSRESATFLDALFTATSASCVTGLVVVDTFQQWSLFGQFVILLMIQIGGLGFISLGVFVSVILRRKIGLKQRGLMQESVNTLQIGGVVKLAKKIILGTFFFEGVGALLLAICFIPQFGFFKGLYYGIFHSISAFCNAGFDLMGAVEPYSSFVSYYNNWIVNLVLMSLVIIGGIGFVVWDDLSRWKHHFSKYMLHTKVVLVTTVVLVFGSACLFYIFERENLLVGMDPSGQILTSLFSSVTARTAGFNTVDTAALTDGSKLLTMILMLIGGSPGSTAGGVKTTTLLVLLLCVNSNVRQTYGVNIFGRRLGDDTIRRATTIVTTNLLLALCAALAIMAIQPMQLSDVLFETFSAIGTVGMTTGVTRDLLQGSRLIIILLMFCGRIGSLSFALAFTQNKKIPHVQQPVEKIIVG